MKIEDLSYLDHIVLLSSNLKAQVNAWQVALEQVGFLLSEDFYRKDETFESLRIFAGREFIEIANIKSPSFRWHKSVSKWAEEGKKGLVCVVFRTYNLDFVYRLLEGKVYVEKPYREEYVYHRYNRSTPWKFLDLPPLENFPLLIRWIERDTMVDNMMASGPSPNSRDIGGVEEISELHLKAPFSESDFSLLKKVFPSMEHGDVSLKKGKICFKQGNLPKAILKAYPKEGKYSNNSVKIENLYIET